MFKVVERDSYLAISFHAAESANAFSLEAARELRSICKTYQKWPAPVVVRSGHARVFCSGGNLKDYAKLKGKAAGLKVNREITACLDEFAKWRTVKIAAIEGDVFGGGMEWIARFDFRLSTPAVVFAFWQRRIGLSPGWGGGAYWADKLGEDRLRQLLMEARPLSATEALREGLVDRVIPQWKLSVEVEKLADDLRGGAVQAARGWKRKTEAQVFSSLWLGLEHKAILQRWK